MSNFALVVHKYLQLSLQFCPNISSFLLVNFDDSDTSEPHKKHNQTNKMKKRKERLNIKGEWIVSTKLG